MDDGRPTGKKERPISPIDDDFLDTYEDERHPRECSSPCERTHKDSSLAAGSKRETGGTSSTEGRTRPTGSHSPCRRSTEPPQDDDDSPRDLSPELRRRRPESPVRSVVRGSSIRKRISRADAAGNDDAELEERMHRFTLGKEGLSIPLVTNYFKVKIPTGWTLRQYQVTFIPPIDEFSVRKSLIRTKRSLLNPYIYDGFIVRTPQLLPSLADDNKCIVFHVDKKKDKEDTAEILMEFKLLEKELPLECYDHFYSLVVRSCMKGLGLENVGHNYFEKMQSINFPHLRIQIWPGYSSVMKQHGDGLVLLNVDITHKVIRMDNALEHIRRIMETTRKVDPKEMVNQKLRGTIVLTKYNINTYRIDDVDFTRTPYSTFQKANGESTSFAHYFSAKYCETVTDMKQPLLLVTPIRNKTRRREGHGPVYLVPELCHLTGLSDEMRANFTLMKELAKHLHKSPMERVEALNDFMAQLQEKTQLMEELKAWGFEFETDLVHVNGRVLPKQHIFFARGEFEIPNDKEEWTAAFRSKRLLYPVGLKHWVLFVTNRDSDGVDNLIRTMQRVAGPLGITISLPKKKVVLPDARPQTYIRAMDDYYRSNPLGVRIEMAFFILPNNNAELYKAIKKRCVNDLGVSSQCILSKNVKAKGLMSIATKIVIQMCAKVGGDPWTLHVPTPTKGTLVVAFDTYRRKNGFVGAMVGTLNDTFTKYYNFTSYSEDHLELIRNICVSLKSCIEHYESYNREIPERIILYREGSITDETSQRNVDKEIAFIKLELDKIYSPSGVDTKEPPLIYILMSKMTSTRLMMKTTEGRLENVPPGTVLDHTITSPKNVFDFFLVSSSARQGTASPCYYTIVSENGGLDMNKLQILTYKLCHMYFNWSGSVAVPAPFQYAKKLAALQAVVYENPAHSHMHELLYYL